MDFDPTEYIYHATSSVYLPYIKLYGFGKFPDEIYIPMKKIYDKKIFNMDDISIFITNQEKIREEKKFMNTWFTTANHLKDIEFYGINGRLQGLEYFNNNLKQWRRDNLSNEEIKKERIRDKHKKYILERGEIVRKIYRIIGLEEKDYFYSHTINNSEEIQKEILNLSEEIIKYYATSTWSGFKNDLVENKAMSIIKSILKDDNINVISKQEKIIVGKRSVTTTLYRIIR
jgi:hypothetical protein